ncbi:6-phosphogluconate dehydrogenase NAD-binding protein [Melioribacter roseus P3M-2]|uniref:6-phosphogluconate dehydrogenase NAD-binding protein n=1 Tax=Melioribacter roseus (strain DSM 23840 / JCM 17771 / VKM B-2668 / P3M-2) TaxID=1191523 RepID=I7A166_MELRP|nr:NAD(P)-dependent oxidoreductase [Melioribacter roseus]AFN74938.1 6-phosphogluconate dehydrogenase NAD-binding protein [Melioribacter roseus P3M-2]
MKVAFIGTGLMGEPMAFRLLKAGYNLFVFNRTKSKTERLKKHQAKIFDSAADAVKETPVIITMLTDFNAISETLFSEKISFKGKTLIQMSTISPNESLLLKNRIEENEGEYIEAPVLGSIPQVEEGRLVVMVGASKENYNKWKKLLKNFGDGVYHVGDIGSASAMKLALNQLIASLTSVFSMSLGYILASNVDVNQFMEILRKSALYAPTFDKKLNGMLKRDFDKANFPLKHLLKDVNLIQEEFAGKKINTEIIEKVRNILQKGMEMNMADKDYSALFNVIYPKQE